MKKGFTLLELIVVIIILGILATLGFTQYTKMVEKGRTAEAKMILGQLRTAETAYYQEYGAYTDAIDRLAVNVPTGTCIGTHYFRYGVSAILGTATRCTVSGKTPNFTGTAYTITLDHATGVWSGTPGYY
ncbi:MAG: prepilin-type N-terminal cleavage/methylation domain-containing protein [Candidatus Omnitrophica bacterium]|nr:prepilin-type N-terminal cleavage/methylation domain-containing protein [Candidatus Omnitrophota bacterium]